MGSGLTEAQQIFIKSISSTRKMTIRNSTARSGGVAAGSETSLQHALPRIPRNLAVIPSRKRLARLADDACFLRAARYSTEAVHPHWQIGEMTTLPPI
jgi:hypothetical protein